MSNAVENEKKEVNTVLPVTFNMQMGGSVRVNKMAVGVIGTVIVMVVVLYNYGSVSDVDVPVSLKKLLAASIDAAQRGGRIVYKIREEANLNVQSKGKTREGANNPVTDGDMKSHLAMFYSLKKAFPGIQVISEEHDTTNVDASTVSPAASFNLEVDSIVSDDDTIVSAGDIQVWIDPLDATQEYTENLREYVTTMVCVAVKGYPTIGVIHKPFENLTVWGWTGKGVSPALHVTAEGTKPKDDIPQIIVSRSHSGDVKEVAVSAFGENTEVIPAGGAGYKTLAVIQGDADAYVHVTLIKKWDLCAGNAILNALNGKMTTLNGNAIDYSKKEEYRNEGGVLATLYEHDFYLPKLQHLSKKPRPS